MTILDRIDAAIDGLCPCGAQPRPGATYCSDDCTPTHLGSDTTAHWDGTAMRWRPDPTAALFNGIAVQANALAGALAPVAQTVQNLGANLAESLREMASQPYTVPLLVVSPADYARLAGLFDRPDEHLVAAPPPEETELPSMLALIEARRRRGPHGPQPKRRAPRRLDPSRRR